MCNFTDFRKEGSGKVAKRVEENTIGDDAGGEGEEVNCSDYCGELRSRMF